MPWAPAGCAGWDTWKGRQKLFYLPEPHTDFIFANIAEEMGLIGALVLVALFVALGYRGLRTAILSKDPFARFLAFGITCTILIQAFFNISVVLALVPTKGIPLPVHLFRRHVALHHAGERGRAAEYYAGDRLSAMADERPGLRVLIAGGGTGGHIIPALAIARELEARFQAEVRFVGTARGLETKLVPQAGYPLELIHVGQLKNVSMATRLRTLFDLPLGLARCFALLREFRPQVVVGVWADMLPVQR